MPELQMPRTGQHRKTVLKRISGGAGILDRRAGAGGSDVQYLDAGGVPTLAPIVDTRTYFDYHHSAADTLDKVDPENIRRQVALMAMMAYFVAEMPEPLPRLPPSKPHVR